MKRGLLPLLILFFLGLVVRFFFIPNPGFEADIAYWKSWSLAASDKGTLWTILNTNYNYPPAFIYLLWVLGKAYSLLSDPHDFSHYWQNTNLLFLFLVKLIPILSDLGIAFLLFFLGRKMLVKEKNTSKVKSSDTLEVKSLTRFDLSSSLPLLMAGLYLFNPVSILDGSLWGQVDSFGVAIFLLSATLLFLDHPLWASGVFVFSFLLKLQNIIYIPIFFLFIFLKFGKKVFFKSLAASAAAFFFFCLEYLLKNESQTIIRLILQNADWFPYLSLNAYNIWWIVSGANGMGVSDKILTFGIVNAKTLGLILFSGSYLLCLGLIFNASRHSEFNSESTKYQTKILKRVQDDGMFGNLILSCLLAVFSFYLLLTQAHERYIFPAIVFLVMLLPYYKSFALLSPRRCANALLRGGGFQRQDSPRRSRGRCLATIRGVFCAFLKVRNFWKVFFIVLTLTSFYNLHNALVLFYPQNGLPLLSSLDIKVLTAAVSVVNIGLFGVLLSWVIKKVHFFFPIASLGFISLSLLFLNSNYLFKKEVSLTNFKPIRELSTFAPCQKNKSVNSNFGWKYWNRLSVNYFFYQKGFGCHANSELSFDLNKKFSQFATDIGVDTEAGVDSSVVFKIYGDKKLLFASEKMGRFDLPKHLEVDIQGIKTLTLVIEDAGDGNRDDHADWLNPTLSR